MTKTGSDNSDTYKELMCSASTLNKENSNQGMVIASPDFPIQGQQIGHLRKRRLCAECDGRNVCDE